MLLKNELTELSFTSFLNGYFSTVRVVKLVYSPQWFFGKDILIDIVSIFVLLLIAFFSIKYYNIKKNRNYIYLTLSFVILAASFLAKILINFNVYYKVIETQDLGVISAVYQGMKATHSIFITSFVIYWLSTLFGYYILYSIYQNQSLSNFLFGAYLISVSTYISYPDYRTFHLTLLVILSLITALHLKRYLNNKYLATKLLALSFGIITLSQIFFILIDWNINLYVTGELIQLVGYISLLFTFIMVLKYGRQANKDRHNW